MRIWWAWKIDLMMGWFQVGKKEMQGRRAAFLYFISEWCALSHEYGVCHRGRSQEAQKDCYM